MDTAQTRFRDKYHQYLMEAFVAALVVHFLLFYLIPQFEFTPYQPSFDWTTIIMEEAEPVPLIEEPKEVKQPTIKHIPIINEEPGNDTVELPVTSPFDINDLVITPMPTQETFDFIPWDRMPELLKSFSPAYPELARKAGIEGKVLLRVTVGADGLVEDASVIHSDVTPSMEKAAIAAVIKFKFSPAMQRHIPVRSLMAVPVIFKLH